MKIGMFQISEKDLLILGGVAALFVVFGPQLAKEIARVTARATGGVVTGAFEGAVIGAGEAIGVPPTNEEKCRQDLSAGRTWDAAFDCPAATYIQHIWKNGF